MTNRKTHSTTTLSSCRTDAMIDSTRMGIPGIYLRMRSGRSARAVLMSDTLPSAGKKMGSQPRVTTRKSSWHHLSRRYECFPRTKPYASTLHSSSNVKMPRKYDSEARSISAFCVPGGSSGDSQDIAPQLMAIVSSTIGSNGGDSTRPMASRRGSIDGRRQKSEVPSYTWPLRPRTELGAVAAHSAPTPGLRVLLLSLDAAEAADPSSAASVSMNYPAINWY
eukprot:scaffold32569_cov112-Isochrysis_galbana.AAC.2